MSEAAHANATSRSLHVFLVVGEESGDQLGASLMRALRAKAGAGVRFSGVGGAAMAAEGLDSIFPLTDITLFGVLQVAGGLARILRRIAECANAAIAANPDVVVIVDSPDFTHRVARRVRARAPHIRIVNYVSPSVWAWRPGRARAMRGYIDHVMALLPFEPAAHARLGGPPSTYVGHPLAERLAMLRPNAAEMQRRTADPPLLLVLPGSRPGEVRRLIGDFGKAVETVSAQAGPLDVVLPTLPHICAAVEAATRDWAVRPRIVVSAEDRYAAFRSARAALAASGTVTLELALAGVPMVAAYRVALIEAELVRWLVRVPSVVLANLVVGENVVPEFLQYYCTPKSLSGALLPLLSDTPERRRQTQAFARLDAIMQVGPASPSARAADIVIATARP